MPDAPQTTRTYVLDERPTGTPTEDDFRIEETSLPDLHEGQVLVRTTYVSVDPYMRGRMRDRESYASPWDLGDPVPARAVGEVLASKHPRYETGDLVVGFLRWAEHAVADGDDLYPVDTAVAPPETYLGALGMPGQTAYFGMLDVAEPRPGDTVVVSAAAGAVGSVAGQLAGMAGGRVVGIAGSDEKTDWLVDDLGFDAAVNYESSDVQAALGEACPDGVDVYFDNVGGGITDAVWRHLTTRARVAVCGQIALYNETGVPTGPRKLGTLVETRARVEGFLVGDFSARFGEAAETLGRWVATGEVVHRETVVEGFESIPSAFLGLFEGTNLGKLVVKVG